MPESDCASTKAYEPGRAKTVRAICPRCGGPGAPVKTITLKQMALPELLELANKPGFHFCGARDCEVAYFRREGEILRKQDLRVRVGLKETKDPVPLCYCFGFTEEMIREEIRATGECTVPQRIAAEVKAGNCACEIRNPQGRCCLGLVTSTVRRQMESAIATKAPHPQLF
ncbi:hypothetical protein GC207_12925 [bacterium]|nr:hypothetical protein [bacterium]